MPQYFRWEFPTESIPVPPQLVGEGYSLDFNDEFEGTELDPDIWTLKQRWESEPPEGAIEVSGGTVKIRNFVNGAIGNFPEATDPADQSITTGPYWGGDPVGDPVKREWTYGYFEARMKWTLGDGSWPAFWLLDSNRGTWEGYPNCANLVPPSAVGGEHDVMEWVNSEPTFYHGTVHLNPDNMCGTANDNRGPSTEPAITFGTEWHTFGLKWVPGTTDALSYYVDDVLQGTQDNYAEHDDHSFYLALTMQACGWDGNPCTASTPATLETECDWVRVWTQ